MSSDFEVEHYLDHQGESFSERFDALSYIYLTRLMDYFDPFAEPIWISGGCQHAFWRSPSTATGASAASTPCHLVDVLRAGGVDARHVEVSSPWGHDSFLLEGQAYHRLVAQALCEELESTSAPSGSGGYPPSAMRPSRIA